ncbi:MAG: acyl-CoA thioesterase II [Novosphingobium sp.]
MNPTPDSAVLAGNLADLLDVTPLGEDRFEGRRKQGGVGRVFGGQVIAQALASAERTVGDERPVHSLHAYFLRGGSEDFAIEFRVDRQFDGGSFSNRRVVASQQGRPIFNLAASFHKREPGFHHQESMPEVPGPESLDSVQDLIVRFRDEVPAEIRERQAKPALIEVRPVEAREWLSLAAGEPVAHAWFRARQPLADDPKLHRAALAYASDLMLLGTCTKPHAVTWEPGSIMGASLDHALWFHDDFRADEWLLYATDSPWAGNARGFNRGRIFTQDGRLVADVAQEGMIRRVGPKA